MRNWYKFVSSCQGKDEEKVMAWRKGLAGVGTLSASLAGAAYYYRPDPSDELVEKHPDISRRLKSTKVGLL